MSLVDRTKKELVQIIHDLTAKLAEMKPVESALVSQLSELHSPAIGLSKTDEGNFIVVKIKYDIEKNAAAIEKLEQLQSKDIAIAHFNLNKYVAETIVRTARGSKYDQK